MMGWETPLMERHAAIICASGGDVLNVGFGMGIIDGFIQTHKVRAGAGSPAYGAGSWHVRKGGAAGCPGRPGQVDPPRNAVGDTASRLGDTAP